MTASATKRHSPPPPHSEAQGRGRHIGWGKRTYGCFRPFPREERLSRRLDAYVVSDKQLVKGGKGRFYEYNISKTHNTINCSMLKRQIEEKQLNGNLIEVERNLRTMFDAEKANDATSEHDQPREIMMKCSKWGRQEEHEDKDNLARSLQGLMFSAKEPCPKGCWG